MKIRWPIIRLTFLLTGIMVTLVACGDEVCSIPADLNQGSTTLNNNPGNCDFTNNNQNPGDTDVDNKRQR